MNFTNTVQAALAALALGATPALADWSTTLITLGATDPGATGEVECQPNGSFGTVWGTGTYTSDSSICTAAVHYGWIQHSEGGTVTVRQVPGMEAYQGSANNGVTSSDYGSWSASFQITGAVPLGGGGGGGATGIDWTTSLDGAGQGTDAGSLHTYLCPPGGSTNSTIWGTDVYTSDSAICVAAAHRGLISTANGGPVTVLVLGSQPAYTGSSRNGVTSSDYPSWDRSYVFQ